MAKFSAVFSNSTNTEELGYKLLPAFFSRQFRPQAPDMVCGMFHAYIKLGHQKGGLMKIYNNCIMTTLYHSNDPSENYPCVVKLGDDRILVEYEYKRWLQYEGATNGEGHFELHGVGFQGKASLHMFPGSLILEGSWLEEGYRGMWRIKLA